MADVQAADVAAPPPDKENPSSDLVQDDAPHTNGQSAASPPGPESSAGEPESAHAEHRRENESARVREARKWNNRDRNKHEGGNRDRPYRRKLFSKNNKFDPSSLPESDDPALIRKQVEFYFSDSNLHGDKFLFMQVEGSKNNPVPVDVIHKFKRMQRFQPRSAIVAALKESSTLNVVNDDNDIQRKIPLPEGLVGKPLKEIKEVHESKYVAQSIYAKGFGEEVASSQFDIEAFFAKYGTTNSVRLRRDMRGGFKGSVFVEFDNEEQAKSFVALDPPPKYKDQELLVKSKKEYCDGKIEDIKAGKVRPSSQDRQKFANRKDRDSKDDRDWRERRDEDSRSGFQDRRGNRRGGGRSRGSRGDRGRERGRGGRDGDRRPRRRSPSYGSDSDSKNPSDEPKAKASEKSSDKPDATMRDSVGDDKVAQPVKHGEASDAAKPDQNEAASTVETPKKRQREDDEVTEALPPAKKLDDKTSE